MGYYKSDARQTELIGNIEVSKEGGYRIECKSTVSKAISINSSWFGKISKEARDENQLPALFLQLGDLNAWALTPCEVSDDAVVLTLGESSTRVSSLSGYTHVKVPLSVFDTYKTGAAYKFEYWQVEKVND